MFEDVPLPAKDIPVLSEAQQGMVHVALLSEVSILGWLMVDNHAYPEVMFLRQSDFYDPVNGMVFDAILTKMMMGELVNAVTLKDELHDKLNEVGGSAYFSQCLMSFESNIGGKSVGQHAIGLLETHVQVEAMSGAPEAELRLKYFRNHSLTTMPYAEYLTTSEWQNHRARTLNLACHRCQLCGRRDCILQAHHNTYERRGAEWPCDLIALCMPCHERFHNDGAVIELDPDLAASLQATGKGWAKRLNMAIRSWMFLTGAAPNKVGVSIENERASR